MRRLAIGAAVLAAVCTAASRAGTVSFTSTTLSLPLSFSRPTQLALADLDGAHGQDLVVLGAHGDVGVFLNNGNGTFAMPLIGDSGCSPADSFAGGQFGGDSQLDVVVACGSTSVWHRLRGKGDGTFTAYDPLHDELPDVQPHGAGGSETKRLTTATFGSKGGAQAVLYAQTFGGGTIRTLQCFYTASDIAADLDSAGTAPPRCSRNFAPDDTPLGELPILNGCAVAAPPFANPEGAAFAVDPDSTLNYGTLDALTYSPDAGGAGWNRTRYIPMHPAEFVDSIVGAGRFKNASASTQVIGAEAYYFALYDPGAGVPTGTPGDFAIPDPAKVLVGDVDNGPFIGGLVTGDYDGDGNLDVAVLADSGNDATSIVQLHRGNGDGAFAAPQTFATRSGSGANPQIASADLNGDGKPDLANIDSAVAAGDVTVLLNTTPAPPPALPPPPPPPPPPLPPPPPPPVPKVRCIVPRVIGKTVAQARTALHTHHCRLGTVGLRYSKVKRGHVLSQSRAPGSVHPVLTKVNVVVSRGRRPI
jgi:hypothetical protein